MATIVMIFSAIAWLFSFYVIWRGAVYREHAGVFVLLGATIFGMSAATGLCTAFGYLWYP